MKRALLLAIAACGGAAPHAQPKPDGDVCARVHEHVEQLYLQGPPAAQDPKLAREVATDNTHMVMRDCAIAPDRVAPCAERAQSVDALEHQCLIPLDADGREAERPLATPMPPEVSSP